MTETQQYNEIQDEQIAKQSPTNEDVLNASKHSQKASQISIEAKQVQYTETKNIETDTDNALQNLENDSDNRNIYKGGVDYSKNLSQIESEIANIEQKIKNIEAKNELTTDEKRYKYRLKKQRTALDKKRDSINADKLYASNENNVNKVNDGKEIDVNNANKIKELNESDKKNSNSKERIAQKDAVIKALSEIKQSMNLLSEGVNKEKILGFLDGFENIKDTVQLNEKKQKIIDFLSDDNVFKSITDDLIKNNPEQYEKFRDSLIKLDSKFIPIFENIKILSIELSESSSMAKMKMRTNLDGVDLTKDILTKKGKDNITTTYSKDEGRSLSIGDMSLKSEINSNYEMKLEELNKQNKKELIPLNEDISNLSKFSNYIENVKQSGEEFSEMKKQIQLQNPELYNLLGLENKNNYEEMIVTITNKKDKLTEVKKELLQKYNEQIDTLVTQNQKEAVEKDKNIKEMLKYLDLIGFNKLDQGELKNVISQVNLNPGNYGLDMPIDFENGSLGFNMDFGNSTISSQEKIAFAKFFNKMLGEEVVQIDEKNQKVIPLDTANISKLQKISNQKSGFFIANLQKEEETTT